MIQREARIFAPLFVSCNFMGELHFRHASASVSGMPLYLFSVSGYTLPEALVLY